MLSGERAFVYAKSCGIIGKSFIGKNAARLRSVHSLAELDRLIFPDHPSALPERELLLDLERRITRRCADHIVRVASSFAKPPPLLSVLVRSYEYSDLKFALNALANGEKTLGGLSRIGSFAAVNFAAYPDLHRMLDGTEFAWIAALDKTEFEGHRGILLQIKLDSLYYKKLRKALEDTPARERAAFEKILAAEISLRNAVWALRLKMYYGMSAAEIAALLVDGPNTKGAFRSDALSCLSFAPQNRAEWRKWRWFFLLAPERPGETWTVSPRQLQNAAAAWLYRLAVRAYRSGLFSLDTSCCFIKLKQFEEDLLTSVAEGLRLGVAPKDLIDRLEVQRPEPAEVPA
jgi:vacuolar-type H+-ATPase subunit C/Vma6